MTGLFRRDGVMVKDFAVQMVKEWKPGFPARHWADAVGAIVADPRAQDPMFLEEPDPPREPGDDDDEDVEHITVGDFLDGVALGFFKGEEGAPRPRFKDNGLLWDQQIAAVKAERMRANEEWLKDAGSAMRAAADAECRALAELGPMAADEEVARASALEDATAHLRARYVEAREAHRRARFALRDIEEELYRRSESAG